MRIVLSYYEFAPPTDVPVFEVAFLAEYYAIMKGCVTAKLGGFLEMWEARIHLERLTAAGACFLLPDEGFIFYVLRKFLGTHICKPRL